MSAEDLRLINKVVEKINSGKEAIIVPVVVEAYSIVADCFYNVEEKVKRDGGSVLYGWSVLFSSYLCEAERHAIWKSSSGELIDITQHTGGMQYSCFVEEDLDYQGQLIDNVRVNITENKIVDDWIMICETKSKIESYATQTRVDNKIQVEYSNPIHIGLIKKYEHLINVLNYYLNNNATENSICCCKSGKIYKDCHSTILHTDSQKDLTQLKSIFGK